MCLSRGDGKGLPANRKGRLVARITATTVLGKGCLPPSSQYSFCDRAMRLGCLSTSFDILPCKIQRACTHIVDSWCKSRGASASRGQAVCSLSRVPQLSSVELRPRPQLLSCSRGIRGLSTEWGAGGGSTTFLFHVAVWQFMARFTKEVRTKGCRVSRKIHGILRASPRPGLCKVARPVLSTCLDRTIILLKSLAPNSDRNLLRTIPKHTHNAGRPCGMPAYPTDLNQPSCFMEFQNTPKLQDYLGKVYIVLITLHV